MNEQSVGYLNRMRLFGKDAKLYIASSTVGAFSYGITSVILNLYLVSVGFSEDFIGFFLSVSMFATAVIAIIAGMVADRTSRKRIVLLSSAVTIASYFLIYTSVDGFYLILAQVLIGLAGAFSFVSWSAYISDLSTDEERAHLFGISGGISLLLLLAGNILGGFMPGLMQTVFSISDLVVAYRFTLYISLLPSVLSGFLVVFMAPDKPSTNIVVSAGRIGRFSIRNVSHWGFIGRYATTVGITGLGAGMIVIFFNIFFDRVYAIDASLIGIIFGLNTVVLAVGNFVSPVLADRIGKVRTIVLTQGVSVPFLVMLSIDTPLYIAVMAFVSRNVLMNMAGPVTNAFFVEGLTKEERATALGVVSTGDQFVRGIAANMGGWLLFVGQYRLPYLLTAILYVVSITLFMWFFRNKEREMKLLRQAEVVFHEGPEIEAT